MIAPSIFASSYSSCGVKGTSSLIPPLNRNESSFGSPITIRAPSLERMMSSIAERSSVPGAMRPTAARIFASRRGSCCVGCRTIPSGGGIRGSVLSWLGSLCIDPRLRSLAQRLCLEYAQCATNRRAGRGDRRDEAELVAFLEPALGLRGRPEPAREADLAEGRDLRLDGRTLRSGDDCEGDGQVGARLVDA